MTVTHQSLVSVKELNDALGQENLVVLDCRYSLADFDMGRRAYFQSHIPGAVFMDIGLDLSSPVIKGVTGRHPLPHPKILASSLRAAGINSDSQVVAYDQSNGMYASRAWWLLHWLGHSGVALLDGGFNAWLADGLATDNQCYPPGKGNFKVSLQPHLTVTRQQVAAGKDKIIDSRDYKRFIGETEPIDPVAGHIPGATCIPFMDNTDDKGFWKSGDFLKQKFSGLIPEEGSPPVFYCGSGVSACHNIFAYHLATGKDARLYPGSWSEWINYYPPVTGP
jgi:thiosulfate/3-mercaptopyruvate sulfurtransferase